MSAGHGSSAGAQLKAECITGSAMALLGGLRHV